MPVLIVVGGPQYRAGSHRQFVQLARALASHGHPCLRFDVRGMGDSTGEPRSFEFLDEDLRAGIDTLLKQVPGASQVALAGLCDGASAALMYLERQRDIRVAALCLLNPWLRSDQTLARAQVKHYYWKRATSAELWRQLLRGQLGAKAYKGLLQALRAGFAGAASTGRNAGSPTTNFRETMLSGFARFEGPALLALSGQDLTAREFSEGTAADPRWRRALARPGVVQLEMPKADHTLSTTDHRLSFETAMRNFLGQTVALASLTGAARPQRVAQ